MMDTEIDHDDEQRELARHLAMRLRTSLEPASQVMTDHSIATALLTAAIERGARYMSPDELGQWLQGVGIEIRFPDENLARKH